MGLSYQMKLNPLHSTEYMLTATKAFQCMYNSTESGHIGETLFTSTLIGRLLDTLCFILIFVEVIGSNDLPKFLHLS